MTTTSNNSICLEIITNKNNSIWTPLCIFNINKFLSGIDTIMVVGDHDDDFIRNYCYDSGLVFHADEERVIVNKPHMSNACSVLKGDWFNYPHNHTHICFLLPNFLFHNFFDVKKRMIENDKVCLLCDTYSSLAKQSGEIYRVLQNWGMSTSIILQTEVNLEYARSLPSLYPVELFNNLRTHLHIDSVPDYLNSIEMDNLPEPFWFSEYNVLGAFLHHFHPDKVHPIIMSRAPILDKYVPPVTANFDYVDDKDDLFKIIKHESERKDIGLAARLGLKNSLKEFDRIYSGCKI